MSVPLWANTDSWNENDTFLLQRNTYAGNKKLLPIAAKKDELKLLSSLNTLGFALDQFVIEQSPLSVVKPQLRVLNRSFAIVTSIELRFILFLHVFFNSQQGLAFLARSIGL